MKLISVLMLVAALSLSGCETFKQLPAKDPQVITKYKYIVNTTPEEMTAIPAPVKPIDLATATDKEFIDWLLDSEKRTMTLEDKLLAIRELERRRLDDLRKTIPLGDLIIK